MDEGIVRMQTQMYALIAEMNIIIVGVKGVEAANTERESQGFALAYPESIFNATSRDLKGIATTLQNQIKQ